MTKSLGVLACVVALAACGDELSLPETAWQDGWIVFGAADEGKTYQLEAPQTAKGVRFDVDATLVGETLTLESPAEVVGSGSLLTPLAGADGVKLSGIGEDDMFPSDTSKPLWSSLMLTDSMQIFADICGGVVGLGQVYRPAEMFHFVRNGDTATAQFHCYDDFSQPDGSAKYVKAFKLQFEQRDQNVYVKILWAKYASARMYGSNFDEVAADGDYTNYATAVNTPGAIGITHLTVKGRDGIMIEGTLPAGTATLLAKTVTVWPRSDLTITNAVSGTTRQVVFKGKRNSAPVEWTHEGFIAADEEMLVARNASIRSVRFVSAQMSGGFVNNKNRTDPSLYGSFSTVSGNELVLQVQYFDPAPSGTGDYTKMVFLHLVQRGSDIYLTKAEARNIGGNHLNENNAGGGSSSVATGDYANGYGIHNVVLSTASGTWPITLTGDCHNELPMGTQVVVDGTDLTVNGRYMLPRQYDLIVTNGASLTFSPPASTFVGHYNGETNAVTVCSGCTFTVAHDWNLNEGTTVSVDDGVLALPGKAGQEGDCMVYVPRLTLRNGARVTGKPYRAGYYTGYSYFVHSTGNGQNILASGVMGVYNNVSRPEIDYYLFRTDADLLVTGPLIDGVQWWGMNWAKTGDATLTLAGRSTAVGWFRVEEGTLRLGADGALSRTNAVTLAGGALDGGAFTNRLGVLTLTADSAIDVGYGVMEFSDSSAAVWTPGASLALTGTAYKLERGHIRFHRTGSDGLTSGLTSAQLAVMRYNGDQRVELDNEGWLKSCSEGTLIIVR